MVEFKYMKVRDVRSPERGTPLSAGIDFFVPRDFPKTFVAEQHDILIPSGIKAQIPEGYMLIAEDKSGVVTSRDAKTLAGLPPTGERTCLKIGAKVIDEDYQGEIHIHIINVGSNAVWIEPNQKIAQFILVPVSYAMPQEVHCLEELYPKQTKRGNGGFGSTNK